MRLLRLAILLLLATIIVAEPVVHTHPFAGRSGDSGIAGTSVCALCAVAAQQITVVRTNITAPATAIALVVTTEPLHQSLSESRPLASRAPPIA
jgi:hypothetical protein